MNKGSNIPYQKTPEAKNNDCAHKHLEIDIEKQENKKPRAKVVVVQDQGPLFAPTLWDLIRTDKKHALVLFTSNKEICLIFGDADAEILVCSYGRRAVLQKLQETVDCFLFENSRPPEDWHSGIATTQRLWQRLLIKSGKCHLWGYHRPSRDATVLKRRKTRCR